LPLVFIYFIYSCPLPCAFWLYGPNLQLCICFLLVHYQLLIIYSYVVVCLPVLCLMPCPFFVWGPPGLLATDACYWVGWGLRSLNAAFPCRSCLSYFIWCRQAVRGSFAIDRNVRPLPSNTVLSNDTPSRYCEHIKLHFFFNFAFLLQNR
jgi:hypothetical protein